MPDISMCMGEGCPMKEECYRYKARPSEYSQSYFMEVPYKDESCEYFMKFWDRTSKSLNKTADL